MKRVSLTLSMMILALSCAGSNSNSPSRVETPQASVLMILIDTLRADHLGTYGYQTNTSPHIDQLASRAIVFERAISQSSWTKASVGSLFSSLYPHEHGAILDQEKLPTAIQTLAETLASSGLFTVLYQTNPWVSEDFGFRQGFEQYYFGHYHEQHLTAEPLVDAFLRDLRIRPGQRFFAFIHFMDPHLPYAPPQRWVDKFSSDYDGALNLRSFGAEMEELEDLKEWMQGFSEKDLRHVVSLYDGSIRYVDEQVGRLIAELNARGLMEDTWIIVLSDHGEEFKDHGDFEHGHSMYNEILRVPLILYHPSRSKQVRETRLARLIDVYPTVLGLLGLEAPEGLAGRDLFGLPSSGESADYAAFSEITLYGNEQKAIQTDEFKLIWDTKTGRTELYDLVADPLEKQALGLLGVKRMLGLMLAEHALQDRGPRGPAERVELDPETVERLRALGYLR